MVFFVQLYLLLQYSVLTIHSVSIFKATIVYGFIWKVQVEWVTEVFNTKQHDPLQFEDFNMPFQEDSRQFLLKVFRRLSKKVYPKYYYFGVSFSFLEANCTC